MVQSKSQSSSRTKSQTSSRAKSQSGGAKTTRIGSRDARPVEQVLRPLAAAQARGFEVATAVAERFPGLPRLVGSAAVSSGEAWARTYLGTLQLVLDSERRTVEQLLALNSTLLAPRLSAAQRQHRQSV